MQAERMAREKEEEDEFRRQTMERFAEQDRLEQMNAQKRRIKVAQHAREVERLIQEKRAMFEAAMVSTLTHAMHQAKGCCANPDAAQTVITINPPNMRLTMHTWCCTCAGASCFCVHRRSLAAC